jgi:hypothetical protein
VGDTSSTYRVLMEKSEGSSSLGRRWCRWEDNIKTDLQVEVPGGWGGGVNWIDLAEDRDRWRAVVNEVMNLEVS